MKRNERDVSDRQSIRTTVSIPTEAYRELEVLAEKKRVSIAWVVRAAIAQYLDQEAPLFRETK